MNRFWRRLKVIAWWLLPPLITRAGSKCLNYLRRYGGGDGHVRFKLGDFFLECDRAHPLPEILSRHPEYRRNYVDLALSLRAEEPRVIDVGANIGDTALLLLSFVPGAKILCVECCDRFLPYLRRNTSEIPAVTIAETLLSDRRSVLQGRFEYGGGGYVNGTAHVVPGDDGQMFEARSLDELVCDFQEFAHPDVIKIVVDGFEPKILRGAESVLASARPVLFYQWHPYLYSIAEEDDVGHCQFLIERGYDRFLIFTNSGELMLRVCKPGRVVLQSLARFARRRQGIDNLHYDIVAFPEQRSGVCERMWEEYMKVSFSVG